MTRRGKFLSRSDPERSAAKSKDCDEAIAWPAGGLLRKQMLLRNFRG